MGRTTEAPEEGAQTPDREEVARAIDGFRGALVAGQRPRIEEILLSAPEPVRSGLLRGLLVLELAYRLRIEEKLTPEEYHARFPADASLVDVAFRHPTVISLCGGKEPLHGSGPAAAEAEEFEIAGIFPSAVAEVTPDPVSAAHVFGDYELIEVIERDELGIVYKAHQKSLERIVALRLIMAGESFSQSDVQTFYREAKAAADLDHPGIVPIFEIGQHQGQHFVSMGFVEGQTLAERRASGACSPSEAAELMKQVAETIAFAHGKGVVHRNLSPRNIILNARGRPRVTGFSLSAALQSEGATTIFRRAAGTPGYLAPEQVSEGREIGPATDVYAMGAVLYFLLTARPPFQGRDLVKTLSRIVKQSPKPPRDINPKIPAELETICLKCLRKQAGRRYKSAGALAEDLDAWLRRGPAAEEPTKPYRGIGAMIRKHPAASCAGFLAILLLVLGSSLTSGLRSRFAGLWSAGNQGQSSPGSQVQRVDLVSTGKAASALVEVNAGVRRSFGSAFCVDPSGLFVTAAHVIAPVVKPGSGTISLVVDGGAPSQNVFEAQILRSSPELDLAVLKINSAQGTRFTPLELGRNDGLVEGMEITAFGYPLGNAVPHIPGGYPSVSVNFGRITALRRSYGRLDGVQIDAALNRGNSGGPVVDVESKVIGIVTSSIEGSSGMNYATPVDRLADYLAAPEVAFDPPPIRLADRGKPLVWSIDVLPPLKKTQQTDAVVAVKLQSGGRWREFASKSLGNGRFTAEVVPVVEGRVDLEVNIDGQTLRGQSEDRRIWVGAEQYAMSDLKRIDRKPYLRVLSATGKELGGPVNGLGTVEFDQSGTVKPLNLDSALTIEIRPRVENSVKAVVEVRQGTTVLASARRDLVFTAALDSPAPQQVLKPIPAETKGNTSAAAAPDTAGKLTPTAPPAISELKLAGKIDDVVCGGGGRYLLLVMKDAKKLAVFDANSADDVKYYPLASSEVLVAAGAEKLVVVYPDQRLMQRWQLGSFERDKGMDKPLPIRGVIKSIALGSASSGPILVHWGAGSGALDRAPVSFLDLVSFKPISNLSQVATGGLGGQLVPSGEIFIPWYSSFRDIVHWRASGSGDVFAAWCTSHSPSGLFGLTLQGGSIRMYYDHNSVGHVIPGPDGRVVYTGNGGLYNDQFKSLQRGKSEQLTYLPASDASYYLGIDPTTGTGNQAKPTGDGPTCRVYSVGNMAPLVTTGPLKEMSAPAQDPPGSDFTPDKRYLLTPSARWLVTVPPSNDRLVVRRVDILDSLQKSGKDYFFVSSSPPRTIPRRFPFEYQILAQSNRKILKYELSSGPKGMAVSDEGKVTWTVPPEYEGTSPATVIVSIAGAGGVILHSFDISVDHTSDQQRRKRSGPRSVPRTVLKQVENIRGGKFAKPQTSTSHVSYICVISSPGDFIGQGKTYYYEKEDVVINRSGRGVHINLGGPTGWNIDFGGGRGRFLEVGKYLNARRFPFSGDAPGIEFTGHGRGCNTIAGRFVVLELEIEGNEITRLAIDFLQRCEEKGPPLAGSIRFNSTYH